MNTNYSIIKTNIIQENMMSNPDLIKQFLTLYQTQLPVDFKALNDAISRGDFKDIANKAHHIKPTMIYIGANEQQKKLQKIESAAQSKNSSEIQILFKELEKDYETLTDEIDLYLKHL
ncbi:MAG: Hpt domain-containing protein [Sphingobacterium sp.]|uniref:Hpt domain-containing protein n=1 Tax=Sphingobacterium sp. JB170 TaxID=1434842 RepID=UPI00097EA101|nr:Hpt domain-containing protein [Sphingobacterium sp. JB170]SJN17071.1 hypothetical protein FM107_00810 [Sphingobacterium sp. JB170]